MRISDAELNLFKNWKPGDQITIDMVSVGLLIQEVRESRGLNADTEVAEKVEPSQERTAKTFMEATYGPRVEFSEDDTYMVWMGIAELSRQYFLAPPVAEVAAPAAETFGEWWNRQGRLFMAGSDIHVQRAVMGVAERAWAAARQGK